MKLYDLEINIRGDINRLEGMLKAVLEKLPEMSEGMVINNTTLATIQTYAPFYDKITLKFIEPDRDGKIDEIIN